MEILHRVTELQPQDADVGQPGPRRALFDFTDAPKKAFHREEIDLRVLLRVSQGKASVARAKIEFNGMVVAEKLAPVQPSADVGKRNGEKTTMKAD